MSLAKHEHKMSRIDNFLEIDRRKEFCERDWLGKYFHGKDLSYELAFEQQEENEQKGWGEQSMFWSSKITSLANSAFNLGEKNNWKGKLAVAVQTYMLLCRSVSFKW